MRGDILDRAQDSIIPAYFDAPAPSLPPSQTRASGLVKLNSIPFSMTAYLESVSEEEKQLL